MGHQRLLAHPKQLPQGTRVVILRVPTLGSGFHCSSRSAHGDSQTVLEGRLVQREHPGAVERVVVVELEHLPGLPRVGEPLRVAGRLEGGHADLVAAHVVGVGVPPRSS